MPSRPTISSFGSGEVRHPRRYLHDNPAEVFDEAGYRCEEGIVVDDVPETPSRYTRAWGEFQAAMHIKTREEQMAEEARWASLSGPVTVRKKVS